MKKIIKRIFLVIIALFIVIQFFRPGKNLASGKGAADITSQYHVPQPVLSVLQRSCYDCHSNNTVYPWYSHIQPVAWFLADHIKKGKQELDFSVFANYAPKKAAHKLDEIIAETGEQEMPLSSYTTIHRNAVLSQTEINMIAAWAGALGDSIRNVYQLKP